MQRFALFVELAEIASVLNNIQIACARQQLTLSHSMIKSFHLRVEAFSCNFELNLNAENVSLIVSQKLVFLVHA